LRKWEVELEGGGEKDLIIAVGGFADIAKSRASLLFPVSSADMTDGGVDFRS
jgi:hypothetical protein